MAVCGQKTTANMSLKQMYQHLSISLQPTQQLARAHTAVIIDIITKQTVTDQE